MTTREPAASWQSCASILCHQLLWDPTRDPMQIREEFCRGYYGTASDDVMEFLRRMDKVAEHPVHVFGVWDPPSLVSPSSRRDALRILHRAEAADQDPAVRNRVCKLMLPVLVHDADRTPRSTACPTKTPLPCGSRQGR